MARIKCRWPELTLFLQDQGFTDVVTYIQSGNVILRSDLDARTVQQKVEEGVPGRFVLDSPIIKTLVLSRSQLRTVIENRPPGFGDEPDRYHSDAIFLMGIDAARAMPIFKPRAGVDAVWAGDGVIYSQRLSALRTKSRLSTAVSSPLYKSMTIRNWSTTTRLYDMLGEA